MLLSSVPSPISPATNDNDNDNDMGDPVATFEALPLVDIDGDIFQLKNYRINRYSPTF